MPKLTSPIPIEELRQSLGEHLQENVLLANYTTAHVGGFADGLIIANSAAELEEHANILWMKEIPFFVLGSGSNVLVSDLGYHGVVILNHARNIKIDTHTTPPSLWAESGANFGSVARQAALRGLSGLEWAATIPGTIGGALYGNAGANGSDFQSNLMVADILQHGKEKKQWSASNLEFGYRTSWLKEHPGSAIVLSARLRLEIGSPARIQTLMEDFSSRRKHTQPPGANMGSMFRNPPGDYAGRLIEAAGLKGTQIGGAQISQVHANFFINSGNSTSSHIYQLIQLAQKRVLEKFGVQLELEIEMIGDWQNIPTPGKTRIAKKDKNGSEN